MIKQDRINLISLLDNGAHLYICGDGSKMAPDVEDTLCQAYQEIHEVSEQEARNWLIVCKMKGDMEKMFGLVYECFLIRYILTNELLSNKFHFISIVYLDE